MKLAMLVACLAACGTNGGGDTVACGSGWSQLGLDPASVPTECAPECKDPPANLQDDTAPRCRVHDPYTNNGSGSTTGPYITTSDGRMGACVTGDRIAQSDPLPPMLFEECYAPYP